MSAVRFTGSPGTTASNPFKAAFRGATHVGRSSRRPRGKRHTQDDSRLNSQNRQNLCMSCTSCTSLVEIPMTHRPTNSEEFALACELCECGIPLDEDEFERMR